MKRKLNWKQRASAMSGFAIVAAGSAAAAVPAGFTTALTGLTTDAGGWTEDVYLAIAGLVVIAVLGTLLLRGLNKGRKAI